MMISLQPQLYRTDRDRKDSHWNYILAVSAVDPVRALLLANQLAATYKYEGIAAGDELVSRDRELYGIPVVTA